MQILVAEDNEMNRVVLDQQLNMLGYGNVDIVKNGVEALENLHRKSYDLLLTDIHMPEMDGFELTKKIRCSTHNNKHLLPIIAITANAMSGEAERCFEAGMNDFVTKPVELMNLQQTLEKMATKAKFN